jgi:hypothetical protein
LSLIDVANVSDPSDIGRVEKKLREAEFFLGLMRKREAYALGDPEEFDYLLSAFLSATRSVDWRLRHVQPVLYPGWRPTWDASLSTAQKVLVKFFVDDRNEEVHGGGSDRRENLVPLGVEMKGAEIVALVRLPAPRPGAIAASEYYFRVDGAERSATEACAEYVALLRDMLANYKANHS